MYKFLNTDPEFCSETHQNVLGACGLEHPLPLGGHILVVLLVVGLAVDGTPEASVEPVVEVVMQVREQPGGST
jgi:hypothetical protein